MTEIKQKLISGVVWESIGQFSSLGIQFIVTIVIARILTPADYGVIGLLTVFVAIANILLDSGFSQALIQKKDAGELEFSTVFFLNLMVGTLLYAILYVCSPYIARFYNIPDLTSYARILFLIIPVSSFGLIQNVIIQKCLQFKKSAIVSVSASLLSGLIGIWMAYAGYGIMALVIQQLSLSFIRTVLYTAFRRWKPTLKLSLAVIREMFVFSMNLMLHSLINTVMKNVYVLVIGKYYNSDEVGYYNQANRFENFSASTLTSVIMKVSFPTLVYLKDDLSRTKEAYKRIIAITCFVIFPLMFLLICIAKPLFLLLLTEKWLPAVPYFQLLCLYGLTLPIMQISYNVYRLYKRGKLLVILDSIRHILFLLSIIMTVKYGISVLLIGQFLVMFVMSFVNMYYSGRLIAYSVLEQIETISPYFILAGLIGVGIWMIPVSGSNLVDICLDTILFIFGFLSLSSVFGLRAFKEITIIIRALIDNNLKRINKC